MGLGPVPQDLCCQKKMLLSRFLGSFEGKISFFFNGCRTFLHLHCNLLKVYSGFSIGARASGGLESTYIYFRGFFFIFSLQYHPFFFDSDAKKKNKKNFTFCQIISDNISVNVQSNWEP